MQTPEILVSLLFQTSIRYSQLSTFITDQADKEDAFNPQQLLAYSSRSRYIALPSSQIRPIEQSVTKKPSVSRPLPTIVSTPGITYTTVPGSSTPVPVYAPGFEPTQRRKTPHNFGSYEDMIARALQAHSGPRGLKPKEIFIWMEQNIPGLPENFRASATQALKKGVDRTRFLRVDSGWYQVNPDYQERVKQPAAPRAEAVTPSQLQHQQAQAQHQAHQMQIMQQQVHQQQMMQQQMAGQQPTTPSGMAPQLPLSGSDPQEQERRHEHLQNYQIHQANAAAALASMQTQPQNQQFQPHQMMMTPQGMMPYPPNAAMVI